MTSQLILRTPCEHGIVPSDDFPHYACGTTHVTVKHFGEGLCPGGSETALDPAMVLAYNGWARFTVLDVLAALQGDS